MDRAAQRGIGTLAISMLLLVGASIVIFYLNRSLIFEQRSSANQLRSTTALEVADAGLEWATGMLNRPEHIGLDCNPSATASASFRDKYVPTDPVSGSLVPTDKVVPGCNMSGTVLSCGCPEVPASGTATAPLSTGEWPGFTVSFAAVPGDGDSVRITAVGCNAVGGACTDLAAVAADATATVQAIVKLSPAFRAPPAAALTCGGAGCDIGSSTVENRDVATNGITVNAAGMATTPADQLATIAGLPPENSVLAGDASLAALATADPGCGNSALFRAYFGSTLTAYKNSPRTKKLSCGASSACAELGTAYDAGWRSFYSEGGLQLSGTDTLGSSTDPLTIVSPGAVTVSDGIVLHGLVYAGGAATLGAGTPSLRGALLACGAFTGPGSGTLTYDPVALRNVQRSSAVMVRVPGSWRDFPPGP